MKIAGNILIIAGVVGFLRSYGIETITVCSIVAIIVGFMLKKHGACRGMGMCGKGEKCRGMKCGTSNCGNCGTDDSHKCEGSECGACKK